MILDCGNGLELRPITVDDTDELLKWRNSDEVKKYFIYQKDISREEHLSWLENKVSSGKVVQFIIHNRIKDVDIGSVYIQDIDSNHKKGEYGIFIGDLENNVIHGGSAVCKTVVDYAFNELGLHRLYLRVHETNTRAIKSYENAGFIREGLLRDDVCINGEYINIVWMGIVNE